MRRTWMQVCGALGAAAALAYGVWWAQRPITSKALLALTPSQIPARYAPAAEDNLAFRVNRITQVALSRVQLVNLIHSLDLYPDDRKRLPMEDIVERVREAVRITSVEANQSYRIEFTYPDAVLAQKTTQRLVSHLIDEYVRHRSSSALQTVEFLTDRRLQAARRWDAALAERAAGARQSAPLDRLQLEVAIAQKNYEELSAKLAEAESAKNLEERRQGPLLEMLDPASLPVDDRPAWWGVLLMALGGGVAGLGLGWLLSRLISGLTRAAINPANKPSLSS